MDLTALENRLTALADAAPCALHYRVRPIGAAAAGGHALSRGADVVVPSFSTRKVSVLCAALALARAGRLGLGQRLTVTEDLKNGVQAGILRNLSAGIELSLRDCLVQMMCTSDNICTQLVFEAIGSAVAPAGVPTPAGPFPADRDATLTAALQYVNDYCAWAGMRSTLHREVFPRTGGLEWHHPIDGLTVTTAADQAHLLALIGRGAAGARTASASTSGASGGSPAASKSAAASESATSSNSAAALLRLAPEDCRHAIELMRGIYTPRLGAATAGIGFAEKNGRGLRSLSQVGLALEPAEEPLAAVAVYAETIPTEIPDGVPGRNAAFTLFAEFGRAIEDWAVPVMTA